MAVKRPSWDLISEGLQKSQPVKVWYASDIVIIDFKDMSKGDSTTYGSSSISKTRKSIFNRNKWTIAVINNGGALGKASKVDRIIVPIKYIGVYILWRPCLGWRLSLSGIS